MSKNAHILIIRLSAMGDVAMAVPVVYAFAKAYPEIKISFLSKEFHRPILEAIPNVQFIPAEVKTTHKGMSGMWKLSRSLKKRGITEVADSHDVIRSKMLKRFLGLPAVKIDKGRAEKKALIQENKKDFRQLKTTVERYQEVFEKMGYTGIKPAPLPKPAKLKAIIDFTKGATKKWIGIAPFAAHEGKQYPLDLMREVIRDLDKTANYNLFLFGAPSEVEELNNLLESCTNTKIVAGQLSFEKELNLISQLDLMVSMDSGNGHLAAMYGVPTITLWGVTHPFAGFAPFKQESNILLSDREKFPLIPTSIYGNHIPKGYENVMRTITPEHVIHKVNDVIG